MIAILLLLAALQDDFPPFTAAIDAGVRTVPGYKVPDGTEPVGDAEFLRRILNDLADRSPGDEEQKAFAGDPAPGKRDAKVRELLASKRFADVWARRFGEAYFGNLREPRINVAGLSVEAKLKIAERFVQWLSAGIAEDRPWNELVADMVMALGKSEESPAIGFKAAFAAPKDAPQEFAIGLGRHLLGIRLRCASCHDHPFDRWTVENLFSTAAFAARQEIRLAADGELEVVQVGGKELMMGDRIVSPAFLFGGAGPMEGDRLLVLAGYMSLPSNTQTPRMLVNRVWERLFGRGLVHPVDDFSLKSKPLSPVLQQTLVKDLIDHKQSLKRLLRGILSSELYQLPELNFELSPGERWLRGAVVKRGSAPRVPKDLPALEVPEGWTLVDPRGSNQACYRVPAKGKGGLAGELIVLPGKVEAARSQLRSLCTQMGGAQPKEEKLEGKAPVTLFDVSGTLHCDMRYDEAGTFRALVAVVERDAPWIFRLEGTAETVEARREAFLTLVKSIPR